MAVYKPTSTWTQAVETCQILHAEDKDGVTNYIIEIYIQPYKWQVIRRYKQFVELNDKMVRLFSIEKSLLPPKKLIGNRSETFILERLKGLESYLQNLIYKFELLPEELRVFLDFQKYEIRSITAVLAENFFNDGEHILTSENIYQFTPLQLYAITERLKLGERTCYSNNPKQDFAHVIDFITHLKHLKILGNCNSFESSNIIFNNLSFDLSMFKSLEIVEISNCNVICNLTSVENLRPKLKSLTLYESVSNLSEILLCEILHWSPITDPMHCWPYWQNISYANFSNNSLKQINPSIKLLQSARHIDLSHNDIEIIENLETLSKLSILILKHNKIKDIESLHTRLGNIQCLNLSCNKIKSLNGLSRLFSVSHLYLDDNFISSMSEIFYLKKLPCLEVLNLQNNPVIYTVDYRSQLLLLFGSRAPEITFDGLKPTEKEIDTVSVLHALKQARIQPRSSHITEENTVQPSSSAVSRAVPVPQKEWKDKCSTKQFSHAQLEPSKFRQQVETLRITGGSDWLKLLNEMHSTSANVAVESNATLKRDLYKTSIDIQFHSEKPGCDSEENDFSQALTSFTSSFEMTFPEWLLLLESNNPDFQKQLMNLYLQHRHESYASAYSNDTSTIALIRVVWGIILNNFENSLYEIPTCILLFKSEIVFLRLNKFSGDSSENSIFPQKLCPELTFLKSIDSCDVLSLNAGPCWSYVELRAKLHDSSEHFIILLPNKETSKSFIDDCQSLYNITSLCKLDPFSNCALELEGFKPHQSLSIVSVEKQILFGHRVGVSRAFHQVQCGILHYVFVTPSHLVLTEERLLCPDLIEFDANDQSQFQICALVSIHTNITQIQLKDVDIEEETESTINQTSEKEAFGSKNLNWLYKCGFWLIMEFESDVLLYLKFFSLNQRNEFLNAFLCARRQNKSC